MNMITDFIYPSIISTIPVLVSVYVFYISVTKIIRNKLISYIIFLTVLLSSIYFLGIFYPGNKTDFFPQFYYDYFLKSCSIFLALALIVMLDLMNYKLKFRKK